MSGRSIPEWFGKTDDTAIPGRVKDRVLIKHNDCCAKCGRKFGPGCRPEFDHTLALINGGENRESNVQPLCDWCHPPKTKVDVATKARTYRTRAKNLGIKKPRNPFPGSKASKWKKKMDGTVERRQ